jgi:hypothetical protein
MGEQFCRNHLYLSFIFLLKTEKKYLSSLNLKSVLLSGQARWLKPAILATQEVEIGRIVVPRPT